ncbi:MAG: PadR family transcriptional regulator, partial [Mycobacterium sp.]|nr:PadR family transcriptional regulator [Mycobacterium sp.]
DADGWVHVEVVAQHGRPDKKVYSVTEAGRTELKRWIAEPLAGRGCSVTDARTRELAVKLRGVAHGAPDSTAALLTQIETLRAERAALLDTYLGFEKRQFPDPARLTGSAQHQYLVLRGGIRAEQGSVDWLDEVLLTLRGNT